jgi:ubiquinone/menaquinone biosynthesis C-methylase UbiE
MRSPLAVRELPREAWRAAYLAQQASIRVPMIAAHRALRALTKNTVQPESASMHAMARRYRDLLEQDLDNVDRGYYPKELLFQIPLGRYARRIPRLLRDIPRAVSRSRRRDYRDLPGDVDLESYPAYFRRTFHWQTDGYLSRHSAELYDVGVEFLFMGCADVMRRQVIPPVSRFLAERASTEPARILDVACGTGRTLLQMATAHPGQRYFGIDLSPFYVEAARGQLGAVPGVSLVADNAEAIPFRDGYFDAVTSVYLFHELPRSARRNVIAEMRRVLRPGGVVVIEDSAQYSESEPLAFFLENFAREMHEPFYRDYLRDDLGAMLQDAGFRVQATDPCWVAKVVTAHAPI